MVANEEDVGTPTVENEKEHPSSGESEDTKSGETPLRTDPEPMNKSAAIIAAPVATSTPVQQLDVDDFGLPIRSSFEIRYEADDNASDSPTTTKTGGRARSSSQTSRGVKGETNSTIHRHTSSSASIGSKKSVNEVEDESSSSEDDFKDAPSEPTAFQNRIPHAEDDEAKTPMPPRNETSAPTEIKGETEKAGEQEDEPRTSSPPQAQADEQTIADEKKEGAERKDDELTPEERKDQEKPGGESTVKETSKAATDMPAAKQDAQAETDEAQKKSHVVDHSGDTSLASVPGVNGMSEFSHQQLTTKQKEEEEDDDGGWQTMPAYAPYDIYDDDNKLIAREHNDAEDENYSYAGVGGAGKGYTKVLVDDDAESATSMDDNTNYLFKDVGGGTSMLDDDDQTRDAVSQMQATKDLLTEGQRIAYVGLTRIELSHMLKEAESFRTTKGTKKQVRLAAEAMKMWSQKMMIRLYTHMEISSAEQVMIEQLSEHGVMSSDLTPQLMANARVKNPMAEADKRSSISTPRTSISSPKPSTPRIGTESPAEPPPAYDKHEGEEMPAVRTPNQLPTSDKLDIDIRWTVLCDLFLVLIVDSIYDSRSRVLLERVAKSLEISWIDICRFEKRVTEALEMQQQAERENWNEDEHKENRRKMALKRRYVMMGLATVGGGLVIGLSAGLLAPVIGAGLAAGFTTIGVTGTSSFLAGAGGAAIITSASAASGSVIGLRAANRRTGAVKTFEYRPLHNNKRVNLIVTVSGWLTGKVDDVRLPFSTVDSVMGDIYSVLWEPEMLTSMGDTINILATEALTQGLQQVLGSTILVSLMAALQLPVVLSKLSYLIDNPWAVSLDRAWSAGLIMADSLIERNLGTRPITLVGYSLGSRVIFSCLLELARKGAIGLIQNVYMFGSPIVVKQDEYSRIRTVVAGRFVNGFNRNDWILGYLFRLTNGGIRRIAGLAAVEGIPGVENMDVTEWVVGHMDYRTAMPRLLQECGWLVESLEFTEIEDPDPENHAQRQRELISEIEEARKEIEKDDTKRRSSTFGSFFSRKKKAHKAEWEVYGEGAAGTKTPVNANSGSKTEDQDGNNHGVLFDVEAMRAELAKDAKEQELGTDHLQVKELQSTLPPMKIPSPGLTTPNPRDSLRETMSMDTTGYGRPQDYENSYYGHTGNDDDAIQMTFDTSFDEKPKSLQKSQTMTDSGFANSSPETSRSDMKTSQTLPTLSLTDPWADLDDDPEFGKEKEISMTFA